MVAVVSFHQFWKLKYVIHEDSKQNIINIYLYNAVITITIILVIQHDLRMMRIIDFIQHKLAKCTQARDAWAVGNSETFGRVRSRWER